MDKEEMIKDLAINLANACNNTQYEYCMSRGCEECRARTVINAGYRKVGEDEIVIKSREFELLNKTIIFLEMEYDELNKQLEQTKKETAREILQTFEEFDPYFYDYDIDVLINDIAQKYGID